MLGAGGRSEGHGGGLQSNLAPMSSFLMANQPCRAQLGFLSPSFQFSTNPIPMVGHAPCVPNPSACPWGVWGILHPLGRANSLGMGHQNPAPEACEGQDEVRGQAAAEVPSSGMTSTLGLPMAPGMLPAQRGIVPYGSEGGQGGGSLQLNQFSGGTGFNPKPSLCYSRAQAGLWVRPGSRPPLLLSMSRCPAGEWCSTLALSPIPGCLHPRRGGCWGEAGAGVLG